MKAEQRANKAATRVAVMVACIAGLLVMCWPAPRALAKPPKLIWLERDLISSLEAGITAINVSAQSPELLYIGGRGVVARSTNGGITWEPILILSGRRSSTDTDDFGVEPEDIERFQDSDAFQQLEDNQEALLQELGDLYGDEASEQLLLDLDDAMRQETLEELLIDVDQMLQEGDYDDRLGRLLDAGFEEQEARTMAGGLLTIWQIVTDPQNPSALYVAAAQGLYRSLNQGQSWELLLPGVQRRGPGSAVLSVAVMQGGAVLLAGTDSGLRRSDDGGRTWQPADSGDLNTNPVRATHCSAASTPRCAAASSRGVYISDDTGNTWQLARPEHFNGRDVLWFSAAAAQPDTLWAATRRGVFTSPDGGSSWQPTALTQTARQVVVSPTSPATAAAATDSGVLITTDGGQSWSPSNAGLPELQVRAVAGDPAVEDAIWSACAAGLFQQINADRAGLKAEALRLLQNQWADEPSPADTVAAALRYSHLDDISTDATKARIRLSILAPRVVFRYQYSETRYDRENVRWQFPSTIDPSEAIPTLDYLYIQQRQAQLRYPLHNWTVMALWDIGTIIHNPLEIAAESAADRMRTQRVRTIKRVLRLFSKRRTLQVRMATESRANLSRDLQNRLRLEEYTALLNAYTGGFFIAALNGDPRVDLSPKLNADALALSPCLLTNTCPPQEHTP
jgi:photosystem II stability/assembly factor-like uncharacterized protein